MALQPCPECRSQISSRAHFCPQCGFPFDPVPPRLSDNERTVVAREKRPVGIVVGIALCSVGFLLLFSKFIYMLPIYWKHLFSMASWRIHGFMDPFFRFDSLWQIAGLILVCFGIVQLLFGSSRNRRVDSV